MKTSILSLVLALVCAMPAAAWEARVDGALCVLEHAEDATEVRLTYDPSVPLYTITLTASDPWPVADSFSMRFDGPLPNTISTTRHVLSPDRLSLTVADRGFGNVLDGLAENVTATGLSGGASVGVSLAGAAPAVAAFRACGQTPSV